MIRTCFFIIIHIKLAFACDLEFGSRGTNLVFCGRYKITFFFRGLRLFEKRNFLTGAFAMRSNI